MSHLFAWTGSGVLRKAMKGKMFGFSIAQGGPVPEDILAWCIRHDFNTKYAEVVRGRALCSKTASKLKFISIGIAQGPSAL